MSKVSEKLKAQLITKPGRSVTDLAKLLGMARPSVSNVINGNADLSMELAIKLEIEFGMNGRQLLLMQLEEGMAKIREQMNEDSDD